MIWNPNSILYACIAKDTTILAEFNSKATDLSDLAIKCLEKTPPFHSIFSHTVHSQTYMFFIFDPFVYFGIFDESLVKSDCLLFLKRVKDAFTNMLDNSTSVAIKQRLNSPNSHCFQAEFTPVFHRLLASNSEVDAISSPTALTDPVRRKKWFLCDGSEENKAGVLLDEDARFSSICKLQKAMCICKKQVIATLMSMDLIVCVGFFVILLLVCYGF